MEKIFYKFENLNGNWFVVEYDRNNTDTTFCGYVVAGDESCWPIGHYSQDWSFDQFTECPEPDSLKKWHPYRNEIIAWANGEQIEAFIGGVWVDDDAPIWHDDIKYRVKQKQTTIVKTFYTFPTGVEICKDEPNLKLVFDFETHELLSAEVI